VTLMITGRTDRQTDRQTECDAIPPREEGRINSAQRRRKHCTLAVVRRSQKISPHRDPLPGGAGQPKFNQLERVTTFTYKPSLVRINARSFELSW